MKWDYTTNLPVEGSYQKHVYDGKDVRAYVAECIIDEEYFALFDSIGWDLNEFFLKKLEKTIPKYVYILPQLIAFNNDKIGDYVFDILCGNLWIELPDGYTWGGIQTPIDFTDVCRRMFFCETDEDIFALFADLPQSAQNSLFECYAGIDPFDVYENPIAIEDPDKAARFTRYLLTGTSAI